MTRSRPLDLVLAGLATALVAALLPWQDMLSPTTPTGGDCCTHYAAFVHFHQHILPQGRLWGWYPGALAGLPLFQFYFPLPFLVMSGLSLFFPLAVAFKLGALLPALLFPSCLLYCARRLGMTQAGVAAALALGLAFLLQEENHVWGGNLASMLAGEFAQALGLCLALLYLGRLGDWMERGRGLAGCALLLWLMGLSHAYALLFSLLCGLFFPLSLRPWTKAAWRLLVLYGLGFFLLAHWSLPMLAYSPYTEKFNLIWSLKWQEYFPTTLLPALLLAPLGPWLARRANPPGQAALAAYLACWLAVALGLYLAAPQMNTVTIRFLPFAYLSLVLMAAQGLGLALERLKAQTALALLLLLLGALWSGWGLAKTPHWLWWNNSGVQARELWPSFAQLKDFLSGDQTQPRVSYEHSQLHQRLGSTRSLETLPLWSGRSTLENAYLQASLNSPFVFYLQSETCPAASTPLSGYSYSRLDLTRACGHLALFNVGQFIAIEKKTRALADQHPGLILQRRYGPYSVYKVAANSGRYLEAPRFWPILVKTSRPQELAYLWFRFTDLSVPLVLVESPSPDDLARFPQHRTDSGGEDDPLLMELRQDRLPRLPLDCPQPGAEQVGRERLAAQGLTPGRPLLIKATYHPAWRAMGGEKIYRATPAFMLVFPAGPQVELVFAWAWPHYLGLGLSLLGLGCLLLAWARPGWVGSLLRLGQPAGGWTSMGPRGWTLAAGVALALALGLHYHHQDSSTLRERGRSLLEQGQVEQGREILRQGLARFPQGMMADYTLYDLAMTYYVAGEHAQALDLLDQLGRDFPDSILLPETLHHQALCHQALGHGEEARELGRELQERFPASSWAAQARQAQGQRQ